MSDDLTIRPEEAITDIRRPMEMTRDQIELLKRTICKGATDDELAMFMNTSSRLGLDPFARQVFFVKRWDSRERREVGQAQVSVDGLRASAAKTGDYEGQMGPFWCGPDGAWKDAWIDQAFPTAAKVGVLRRGFREPIWSVATWESYVQKNKEGQPTAMWQRMPDVMLAKCAESQALRRAFAESLSGVYTQEEMGQAANAPPLKGAVIDMELTPVQVDWAAKEAEGHDLIAGIASVVYGGKLAGELAVSFKQAPTEVRDRILAHYREQMASVRTGGGA